eukprot:TRINITY_DN9035_c0_g1_i1.p1 TRINITY_DN9035_c0_g1~~TRINITY_DN9035_c0_g1_i1.p1  ORF type:complete len:798 (+),score=95.80 TRINITY_DN9035_c0_g1_i1:64-2457(+)
MALGAPPAAWLTLSRFLLLSCPLEADTLGSHSDAFTIEWDASRKESWLAYALAGSLGTETYCLHAIQNVSDFDKKHAVQAFSHDWSRMLFMECPRYDEAHHSFYRSEEGEIRSTTQPNLCMTLSEASVELFAAAHNTDIIIHARLVFETCSKSWNQRFVIREHEICVASKPELCVNVLVDVTTAAFHDHERHVATISRGPWLPLRVRPSSEWPTPREYIVWIALVLNAILLLGCFCYGAYFLKAMQTQRCTFSNARDLVFFFFSQNRLRQVVAWINNMLTPKQEDEVLRRLVDARRVSSARAISQVCLLPLSMTLLNNCEKLVRHYLRNRSIHDKESLALKSEVIIATVVGLAILSILLRGSKLSCRFLDCANVLMTVGCIGASLPFKDAREMVKDAFSLIPVRMLQCLLCGNTWLSACLQAVIALQGPLYRQAVYPVESVTHMLPYPDRYFPMQAVLELALLTSITYYLQLERFETCRAHMQSLDAKVDSQLFDQLMSGMCDATVHLDDALQIVKGSEKLAVMLLKSKQSLEGKGFEDLIEQESRAHFCNHMASVRSSNMPVSRLHVDMRDSNGSEVRALLTISSWQDVCHRRLYLVGVQEDIKDADSTRLQRVTQNVHETTDEDVGSISSRSSSRSSNSVSYADYLHNDVLVTYDRSLTIMQANDSFLKLVGIDEFDPSTEDDWPLASLFAHYSEYSLFMNWHEQLLNQIIAGERTSQTIRYPENPTENIEFMTYKRGRQRSLLLSLEIHASHDHDEFHARLTPSIPRRKKHQHRKRKGAGRAQATMGGSGKLHL